MKLLIIEDDTSMILALHRALAATYRIEAAETGKAGLRQALTQTFDAVILDLNLPDMRGLHVCESIRGNGKQTPVLVLTGETSIEQKVALLDSGANDYVTKPFSMDELLARLRALIRVQHTTNRMPPRLVAGDLIIDTLRHRAERGGVELTLTRKEFAILECLISAGGAVISRQKLAEYVWGYDWVATTNTIDVHMKYLRDKVDRPFAIPLIKTIHGLGYKLDASNVAAT